MEKVAVVCRWLVAFVFVAGACLKVYPLVFFEMLLIKQGIVESREAAWHVARLVVALELFLGVGILQRRLLRNAFVPVTMVLLAIFSIHLVYLGQTQGWSEPCGCFGKWLSMPPLQAIIKNVVMIVMLALTYFTAKPEPSESTVAMPALIAVAALIGVYTVGMTSPAPPPPTTTTTTTITMPTTTYGSTTDTIITTTTTTVPAAPSRFARFDDAPKEPGPFSMTTGDCLVAFLNLDCEHCKEMALELGMLYQETNSPLPMYFIFLGEPDTVPDFFAETETEVPYILAELGDFFDFIESSPPELYLLRNGAVRSQWNSDSFDIDKLAEVLESAKE
jgi:hypothetical protein